MRFSFELDFGKKAASPSIPAVELTPEEKKQAYNPSGTPFDPGAPLQAYLDKKPQKEPILANVMTGYNLVYQNTKKPGLSLTACRAIAETCYGPRICIESMKRQMRSLKWEITAKDKKSNSNEVMQNAISRLIARPDGEHLFSDWLGCFMEEVLVPGAIALAPLERYDGEKAGLRIVDTATITPLWTSTGRIPDPPFEAYYQVQQGVPIRKYTKDELIYRPFSLRTWTPYGMSPVEATMALALIMLDRNSYYTNWLEMGNVPPAFMKMPDDYANTSTATGITKLEMWEKALTAMMHDGENRHRIKAIPQSFEAVQFPQRFDWQYEFDEYLMRIFAWVIGVNPVWIIKTSSLGQGSEGLSETSIQEGIRPYQLFVKEMLDDYLAIHLNHPELEFSWIEEVDHNKNGKLDEDVQFVNAGIRSRNEIRTERGMQPIDKPGFDEPMIMTASGLLRVEATEPLDLDDTTGLEPELEPKPVDNTIIDLEKWAKKAKNTLKDSGCPCCSFKSAHIEQKTANFVSKALKVAYSPKAVENVFKAAKTGKRFVRPDYDNMPLVKKGVRIWKPIIKSMVERITKELAGKAEKADIKDYGQAEWNEIVKWLADMEKQGVDISGVDSKLIGIEKMSEQRAASLIGKRWDKDAKMWIDTPNEKLVVSDTLRRDLAAIIDPMLKDGSSYGEIAKAVGETFGTEGIEARALRIARTEAATNYNMGTLAGWQHKGVTQVIVHDGDSGDSCDACADVNGATWSVGEAIDNPIEHPNCVRAFEDIEPSEDADTSDGEIGE